MILAAALLALALAALFAAMVAVNLRHYAAPPAVDAERGGAAVVDTTRSPAVSVLIPARDEAANIAAVLATVLASDGVDLEVVVLDDGSTDGTGEIVRDVARRDARVRLLDGAALPTGWVGKQHACWQLAQAARHPLLVFVDADVRLAPTCLARLSAFVAHGRLGLASGFPRQITATAGEALVVPQILVVLLGYLPLAMARRAPTDARFAAACGQLMAVTRGAYDATGGHAAMRHAIHDGLRLARAVRGAGFATDLCDLSTLATCRMYADWRGVWRGFSKNAREGMATWRALPWWTLLLGGGHVLPLLLLPWADGFARAAALTAALLSWGAATVVARRSGAPWAAAALHPLGVVATLAIQWTALLAGPKRSPAVWRGRTYDL